MMSPTLLGRSIIKIRPLMKLLMTLWLPKPTRMAMAPPSTVKAVSGIPTVRSDSRKNSVSSR